MAIRTKERSPNIPGRAPCINGHKASMLLAFIPDGEGGREGFYKCEDPTCEYHYSPMRADQYHRAHRDPDRNKRWTFPKDSGIV